MREELFPRILGATVLAFLLVAVSLVVVAPSSAGAVEVGVPSGSISPFVWEPTPNNGGLAKWSTGQPTGYFEAETAAMVVEIVNENGNTYVADICLQVEDTAGSLEYAFLEFRPWNETHSPSYLPPNSSPVGLGGGAWDKGDANIWGWNATINSVSAASAGHGQCAANYLGLTVNFTVNADLAFITYGGLLATAGASVPAGYTDPTVPSGQSAHYVNGTFQSRIAGAGDKTINFKGSEILLPGSASLTVVKQVNGGAPARDFSFAVTGQDPLTLAGGASSDPYVYTIPVGSGGVDVTVAETGLDGLGANWIFSSVSCTDGEGEVGSVEGASVDLTLTGGDALTCTFINTYTPDGSATVVVQKSVPGDSAPAKAFDFSITDESDFQLSGGEASEAFEYVIPVGSDGVAVVVSENGTDAFGSNWAFASLVCMNGNDELVNVTSPSAEFTVLDGQAVTCTFTNTYTPDGSATVLVKKSVVGESAPLKSFDFSITDEADFQLAGGGVSEAFEYVIPVGSDGVRVVVSENGTGAFASNWAFTSVSCTDGEGTVGSVDGASVDLALTSGDAFTCTFINTYTSTPPPPPPPPPALGSIGDLVWEDVNSNGVQDPGEPGVPGVIVRLYDATTDALVATDVTDSNGNYLFENLQPGDYYLVFTLPASDDEFVIPNLGIDPGLDSDADNTTIIGRTPVIKVLGNVIDNTWDAGVAFVGVASVQISTTTPAVSPGTLPFTGAGLSEGATAGIALAMLALGGLALLTVRRREEDAVTVATGWSSRLWDVE